MVLFHMTTHISFNPDRFMWRLVAQRSSLLQYTVSPRRRILVQGMAFNIGISLIVFKRALEMVTFCSQTRITSKKFVLLLFEIPGVKLQGDYYYHTFYLWHCKD
jgi:hypothetical protein